MKGEKWPYMPYCWDCGWLVADCTCTRLVNITSGYIDPDPSSAERLNERYKTHIAGTWNFFPTPPDAASQMLIAPTTKEGAEELRRILLELPEGFLSQLYVDLYNCGIRIESAKRDGEKYARGLKAQA